MKIRLMVAGDHYVIRMGLTEYFGMQSDFEVVDEADNCNELLLKLKPIPIDILLFYLLLPARSDLILITHIKKLYPEMHILILSSHYETQTVSGALRAGASAYVCKDCSPQVLLGAINGIITTDRYLCHYMEQQLADSSASAFQHNGDINPPDSTFKLGGKTIQEWKEDCESFYLGMINFEKLNDELSIKIIALKNEIAEQKGILGHENNVTGPSGFNH